MGINVRTAGQKAPQAMMGAAHKALRRPHVVTNGCIISWCQASSLPMAMAVLSAKMQRIYGSRTGMVSLFCEGMSKARTGTRS